MDVFGILTDFIAKLGPCPHPPSQRDNMTLYDGAGRARAGWCGAVWSRQNK